MSLTSKLGKRFEVSLIEKSISAVVGAILTISLARLLEADLYGLLFLAISILSIAKLLSTFGFARSASRYISEYKEKGEGQLPHIIILSFVLTIISSSFIAILLVAGRDLISTTIGQEALSSYLFLGGAYIIFGTIFSYSVHITQGFEQIKCASYIRFLNNIARMMVALCLVLLGFGAIGALFGYVFGFFISGAFGLYYVFHRGYWTISSEPVEEGLRKRIAEYSVPIAISNSAHTIDHRVDTVLLGLFAGPISVAYYVIGKQAVQFIQIPMSALGFTLSPTFGSQKAKGDSDVAARIFETALSYGLSLYLPAAAGLILLAEPTIILIFGDDYSGAVPVLQVLAIYVVLISITELSGRSLDYLGRARTRSIAKVVTAILNVILNVILIPMYGAVGAAIATVITFSLYATVNIYLINIELGLRLRWLSIRFGYTLLITSVISVVVYTISPHITGLLSLISAIFAGLLIWVILSITFGTIDIDQMAESLL